MRRYVCVHTTRGKYGSFLESLLKKIEQFIMQIPHMNHCKMTKVFAFTNYGFLEKGKGEKNSNFDPM